MKIKIFSGNLIDLENDVNKFIQQKKIIKIEHAQSEDSFSVLVVYK